MPHSLAHHGNRYATAITRDVSALIQKKAEPISRDVHSAGEWRTAHGGKCFSASTTKCQR